MTIVLQGEIPLLYPDKVIVLTLIDRTVIKNPEETVSTTATIPELVKSVFPIEGKIKPFKGKNIFTITKGWPPEK
ncbi:MAG: hypothetical protein KAI57_04665 [Candidatus Pacebacteria bacterium]|nr:hypothetical protein [Candidatus Paceibacterota bacterium]